MSMLYGFLKLFSILKCWRTSKIWTRIGVLLSEIFRKIETTRINSDLHRIRGVKIKIVEFMKVCMILSYLFECPLSNHVLTRGHCYNTVVMMQDYILYSIVLMFCYYIQSYLEFSLLKYLWYVGKVILRINQIYQMTVYIICNMHI